MRPGQVPDFKRELAALPGGLGRRELLARVESLFERYELVAEVWRLDERLRKCKAPVTRIASSSAPMELRPSGHKTYTGRTAYLLSDSAINVGWCPERNALVYRWESWTEEDTYLRIPGGRRLYINYCTPEMLTELLHGRGLRCEFDEEGRGGGETPAAV